MRYSDAITYSQRRNGRAECAGCGLLLAIRNAQCSQRGGQMAPPSSQGCSLTYGGLIGCRKQLIGAVLRRLGGVLCQAGKAVCNGVANSRQLSLYCEYILLPCMLFYVCTPSCALSWTVTCWLWLALLLVAAVFALLSLAYDLESYLFLAAASSYVRPVWPVIRGFDLFRARFFASLAISCCCNGRALTLVQPGVQKRRGRQERGLLVRGWWRRGLGGGGGGGTKFGLQASLLA